MTDIEPDGNGRYIYSEQCPICGEHVSVTVPTEFEDIWQARLRMEMQEHILDHKFRHLLTTAVRVWCKRQYEKIRP